jgi:hypothetical protein
MKDPERTRALLAQLKRLGARLALDDFGTGYSSLAYLQQFPVDTLKIDRSFVRGMVTNKDTAEIVASMIGMSRQLGLHVVAEGIEHDDQLAQLRALMCEAGQGNLFAKPLDADQAAELLTTGLVPPQRGRSPNASVRRDRRIPYLLHRGRSFIASHRVAVAVTCGGLLLLSAGLPLARSDVRPALESSPSPLVSTKQHVSVASVEAPAATSVAKLTTRPVAAPGAQSAVSPASLKNTPNVPSAPTPPTRSRGLPTTTSFDVVHLHRLGSCRGRLQVTRDGVAFVPEAGSPDAVALKYAEFLHVLSDDTLTFKSATKTYRFKAAGSRGGDQLREIADRIARSRR